ncbi:glycoside hydrolase family 19 protein [Enterobacter asburiae]|uniref:glycoside hydrolase family 19 protein n=1 Tax=Enterobacter asburiae TaxID=61645 RepID=UPI0021D3A433|nr:hypothetical protein [Enterobacter asburiae]MCU6243953.1 hypothetical protein [Enterobacter asburiae]
METRYPIRKANGKDFDSQEDILALLRQEKHGHWLSGTNDMWHGGIHISRNTAPWSVVTPDTCDGAIPLQCIASGELVAWRVCQDYVMGNLGDKPLQCSPSFLLVRSVHKPTKDPSTWLCFYTLYMHLAPLACYPKWTVYQVTPKGNGLIMRQYSGSEVSGQTVPPEVSHKARLHSGEQVLIERQETFLLHNGQAEVFGLAQRLKDGAPVGDKFWTSARPAYVEPIGEQYGYLPGWMSVALKKGQFDTVVCPSAMTAIKAGDAIGFLGKEEVPDEFSNVTADWFSHIEVLSNDGRMPLFLNNPAQLHTGRQFLLVPEGKQLYQREEKGSSPAFEPVGLTNKGDAADIIPADSATSATDSASVAYLQIRPGTWIRKDDVETVSQNDLAKLKFKAVGQEPVRNQLRSLEQQWVIDAFRWLGSQLWAGRDLESGQLQAYYTRMADDLEKGNIPQGSINRYRSSISAGLNHWNPYVDFFLRRLVVKHESEWHGGSTNPKWNGMLATMTGESLAYVKQWLDAHEWMSQVPEFSKDEAVWNFHPVEFLSILDLGTDGVTYEQLKTIFPQASDADINTVVDELRGKLKLYKLDTPTRLRHFFSQIKGEVGADMKGKTEGFQFSSTTLKSFSYYYRNHPDEAEQDGYEKNSSGMIVRRANEQAIGRKHYLRLSGNRQDHPDDGYNFRGRGLIQITGYGKYRSFHDDYNKYWAETPPDVINNPSDINVMPYAIRSALWFWVHDEVYMFDLGNGISDVASVTNKVNGGSMGLPARRAAYQLCEKVFL